MDADYTRTVCWYPWLLIVFNYLHVALDVVFRHNGATGERSRKLRLRGCHRFRDALIGGSMLDGFFDGEASKFV